jgi:hypothetical protein
VSVVRRDAYRRWAVVGTGIAVLCALPSVVAALPVSAAPIAPTALEARILASADHPYQGYVVSDGALDIPQLPQLGAVSSLLSGETTIRTWFASPSQWRTDVDSLTGEQDMYQTSYGTVSWNFETGHITQIIGNPSVRLPRPDDVVPPRLALRLLHTAGPDDRISTLSPLDIAGISAVGLEITPSSADSTIGKVDIWADPATGVPLQVSVFARGASRAAINTRFLDVELTAPAASDVTFTPSADLPVSTATSSDVTALLDNRAFIPLPASLDGLSQSAKLAGYGASVSGYGSGFNTFAVLYLGDQLGDSAMTAATNGGAATVTFGNGGVGAQGTGRLIRTPLLSVLVVRGGRFDQVFLLAGFTSSDVLVKAAGDLLTYERDTSPLYFLCRRGAGGAPPAPSQPPGQIQAAPGQGLTLLLPGSGQQAGTVLSSGPSATPSTTPAPGRPFAIRRCPAT